MGDFKRSADIPVADSPLGKEVARQKKEQRDLAAKYNEAQERDEHGRFAPGISAPAQEKADKHDQAAVVHEKIAARTNSESLRDLHTTAAAGQREAAEKWRNPKVGRSEATRASAQANANSQQAHQISGIMANHRPGIKF